MSTKLERYENNIKKESSNLLKTYLKYNPKKYKQKFGDSIESGLKIKYEQRVATYIANRKRRRYNRGR